MIWYHRGLCYFVDIGRTDREQIHSRINKNDCRTLRPRRPLSTAYRTKETAVWDRLYSKHWSMVLCDVEWVHKWPMILCDCDWVRKWPMMLHDCVCVCDWLKWVTNNKVWRHALFTKQTKARLEVWWQYTKTKDKWGEVWGKGCGLRMGFQTMDRRRPLSRYMFGVAFLIRMASTVLLSQNPSALLWTVAPSQLMQWLVFWTWTAIPFLGSPISLLVCVHSAWLSVSSWFLPRTPPGNPYRGFRTPLLSAFALGSSSSRALVLFSEFSSVWRQASLPEGHRPVLSSHLVPWWGSTVFWVLCPVVVVVLRFLGVAVGGSLGSRI